jgi:PAS domain-containing protein
MNTGSRPPLTVSPISSLVTADSGEDPRRFRVSRMALVLVGVMRLITQPLMGKMVPGAVDPLAERLALCGLCVLFLAVTAVPRYRPHVVLLARVAIYLGAAHAFSLVLRNHPAYPYQAAAFVYLAAATLFFFTVRSLLAFSAYAVALATVVTALAAARGENAGLLLAGVAISQAIITALSWRNITLAADARDGMRQARDFLGAVLDALPDPVFVLDRDHTYLLANEAMGRVGAPVAALLPDSALVTAGAPLEREILVAEQGGERTALLKLASRTLSDQQRYFVGVIRDISERKELERSLHEKIRELEEARARVKQLQGLLPVCMHCGRIRTGEDWQDLQSYIEHHSEAVFSHGLCQPCMDEHYQ